MKRHFVKGQRGEFTNSSGKVCVCHVRGIEGGLLRVDYMIPNGKKVCSAYIPKDEFRHDPPKENP